MSTQVKTVKPNKYFEQFTFSDIKLIDDHKYVLRGSEKQFIHFATVMFRGEHYVMFAEHERVVEWANRKRLGDETFGFLKEEGFLKPKVYIEKVRYMPKAHDTINTWLEMIRDDDLFMFLLEYFKSTGIMSNFTIKGKSN